MNSYPQLNTLTPISLQQSFPHVPTLNAKPTEPSFQTQTPIMKTNHDQQIFLINSQPTAPRPPSNLSTIPLTHDHTQPSHAVSTGNPSCSANPSQRPLLQTHNLHPIAINDIFTQQTPGNTNHHGLFTPQHNLHHHGQPHHSSYGNTMLLNGNSISLTPAPTTTIKAENGNPSSTTLPALPTLPIHATLASQPPCPPPPPHIPPPPTGLVPRPVSDNDTQDRVDDDSENSQPKSRRTSRKRRLNGSGSDRDADEVKKARLAKKALRARESRKKKKEYYINLENERNDLKQRVEELERLVNSGGGSTFGGSRHVPVGVNPLDEYKCLKQRFCQEWQISEQTEVMHVSSSFGVLMNAFGQVNERGFEDMCVVFQNDYDVSRETVLRVKEAVEKIPVSSMSGQIFQRVQAWRELENMYGKELMAKFVFACGFDWRICS